MIYFVTILFLQFLTSSVGLGTNAPLLQTVSVVYNSMDQVESVQSGGTTLAQYQYDIEGRLFKYINAMGNAWTFGYDVMDRPNGSLNLMGQSGWTNYFLDGSVDTSVDPAGNREEHQYNAVGLPTFTQLKNSSGTLLSKQEYSFNDGMLGYLDDWQQASPTTMEPNPTRWSYGRDSMDRVNSVTSTFNGTTQSNQNWTFDRFGRTTQVYQSGVKIAEHFYDPVKGRPTSTWRKDGTQNGSTIQFGYDLMDSLVSEDDGVLKHESINQWSNGMGPASQSKTTVNGIVQDQRTFAYDDSGHIAQEAIYANNTLSYTNSYAYDIFGRLTGATHGGANYNYSYDLANNLLQKVSSNSAENYAYNTANRMTHRNGVPDFQYDPNGNMTQSGGQSLTWDVRGQLRSVGGSTFTYDAFGRRTKKTELNSIGQTSNKNYGWLGWSHTSGDKAAIAGTGIDSPMRLEQGTAGSSSQVRVPVSDARGSITKVIGAPSGSTLFNASYSPFGERAIGTNTIGVGSPNDQPLGYTGAEHDTSSGLIYLRNRYYSPGLGRFISEDPIGFGGGDNFYAYCGNDPINFTDPLGLAPAGANPDFMMDTGLGGSYVGIVDGGVYFASRFADPNDGYYGSFFHFPDSMNPGKQFREWYINYSRPTYGAYRCLEGYEVARFGGEMAVGLLVGKAAGMMGGNDGGVIKGAGGVVVEAETVAAEGAVAAVGKRAGSGNGFNPFKGMTATEIDEALRAKGYLPRGPDPVTGFGGYVNPRAGRSLHIDPANSFGEPPHVDINRLGVSRMKSYTGPLKKRKFLY